jgi:hypothetical protein
MLFFLKKEENILISPSTSTNAYGCPLLQASQTKSKESQKQSFEP